MRVLKTRRQLELIALDAWVAPNATVIGEVEIQSLASVWFGAVIRGDVERVRIGAGTNIQDLCCLHADPGFPCSLGSGVTVGHRAIIHGATVEDDVLIGMGAILLNGAHVGHQSVVGAGTLLSEGKKFPPRSLIIGTPGRIVRELTDEDIAKIRQGSQHYIDAARQYRAAEAQATSATDTTGAAGE